MEEKYPVGYTIMPIYARVGNVLTNDHYLMISNSIVKYGDIHLEVVGYIVSKCYIFSEMKEYLANGEIRKSYEVVFPYQKVEYRSRKKYCKVKPTRINKIRINEEGLFSDKEEAMFAKDELNISVLENEIARTLEEKDEEYIKQSFSCRMNVLNHLETEIELNTPEMIVGNSLKEEVSGFPKKLRKN